MFFFRILAFLVGLFTLLASFAQLLPEAEFRPFAGPNTALHVGAAIMVFSAIYFFIAVSARRTARSHWRQAIAAALFVLQLGAAAWFIEFFPAPYIVGFVATLLCFTVFLIALFAWPRRSRHSYKYLCRKDDEGRPSLLKP